MMKRKFKFTNVFYAVSLLLALSLLFAACDKKEELLFKPQKMGQLFVKTANITTDPLAIYLDGKQMGKKAQNLELAREKYIVKEKGRQFSVRNTVTKEELFQKNLTGSPYNEKFVFFYDGKKLDDKFVSPDPKPGYALNSFYLNFNISKYQGKVDIVVTRSRKNPSGGEPIDTGEELASLKEVQPGQFSPYLEYKIEEGKEHNYFVHIYKTGSKTPYDADAVAGRAGLGFSLNAADGGVSALYLDEKEEMVPDPNGKAQIAAFVKDLMILFGILGYPFPETADPSTWPKSVDTSKWPKSIDPTKPSTWEINDTNKIKIDKVRQLSMKVKIDVIKIFKKD